jgi:hypothetical protein
MKRLIEKIPLFAVISSVAILALTYAADEKPSDISAAAESGDFNRALNLAETLTKSPPLF